MSFASITAIGEFAFQQIVNTFWYDLPAGIALEVAAQDQLLNAWEATVRPSLVGMLTANYRLLQELCVFYDGAWERDPYLPRQRDVNIPGARAVTPAPQVAVAILSARVEPVVKGPRKEGNIITGYTAVRRGYLALSPIGASDMQEGGIITPAALISAPYTALKNAFVASLAPTGWPGSADPIRVSPDVEEGVPRRGHGRILDARWRPEVSTRRSRKVGVGA